MSSKGEYLKKASDRHWYLYWPVVFLNFAWAPVGLVWAIPEIVTAFSCETGGHAPDSYWRKLCFPLALYVDFELRNFAE